MHSLFGHHDFKTIVLKNSNMCPGGVSWDRVRKRPARRLACAVALAALMGAFTETARAAGVDCDADRTGTGSILYLYFPTTDDSNFPDNVGDIGVTTSPLADFDVADLDSGIGTTGALRDSIVSRVKTDYCEFNIRIVSTTSANGTTNPRPADARWQVVGIGSDSSPDLFGVASNVDTGDAVAQDFARVFADTFGVEYGGAGGVLNGSDSTLERWANAIAGTVSHEAGHDYGLGHNDSISQPTEDDRKNHIMASGSSGGLTGSDRVKDRHFSDQSFEKLAANIGLYEQTVSNWDFINPNNSAADGFTITVLVDPSAGAPTAGSIYTGSLSPWNNVSISADGSETFQGVNYNRYRIDFTDPKGWANGNSGEVGAGVEFHVGVGLTTAYIVRETELRSGTTVLGLHPRVVGYTVDGSFDPENGDFQVTLINEDPDAPLIMSDIEVLHLPRTLAIDEMVPGGKLVSPEGLPIAPWRAWDPGQKVVEVTDSANLSLGNLANLRAVDYKYEKVPGCKRGIIKPPPIQDATGLGEVEYCPEGHVLGLFPSARVYVKATVTDPEAIHFDAKTGRFVTGPLSTRVFFQVPGKSPDLNENGVDDAIDIDNGTCEDTNGNGVCDHIEPQRYKYSAKLVCGMQPQENDGRLVRGSYATTVNILNPQAREVRLVKTLSLTYPPEEQLPGDVLTIGKDLLRPDRALKVDCADIQRRLFPNGLPASYIEGFVVIESSGSLDVSAVYTSRDVAVAPDCGGRPGGGGEHCGCRHGGGGDCKHGCGTDGSVPGGCKPPDSISTTLHVEQIRERLIERAKPPVRQCPDLTVRDIGRPQVSCPAGAGTCETTVDYVIANIGNAASGPFDSRATLDPKQSVTVTQPVGSGLTPGQSTSVTVVTPPDGNCFDLDCTVTVEADSTNRVDECREDNNSLVETTKG
ncbi:CARDB domain-containing protein [Mesorhizobium sp.]|uniref:CARDB domain-containing protein n=1 Tax=Mesorhizobium sp. TaxID=1871066 RepID=UPI00257CBAC4|nr:CARDB domain-containing protein [Mesorhizobium sp.]